VTRAAERLRCSDLLDVVETHQIGQGMQHALL
jgi:hypothetical protein